MNAEIIAVGSEMLTPDRQDTNSLYLTRGLNDLGVTVAFKTIVGDNRQHLTDAIRIALSRAEILLLSGGLGPTEDDLTRECVADALGLTLHRDAALLDQLLQRFAARNMAMPANNHRQADVIAGAEVLPNRAGSAPGQFLDTTVNGARRLIALLPGPPKELKPLFDEEARPRLATALPPSFLARRQLRMSLIPESQVDARTAPIYTQFADVETTILAGRGEIQLHFVCTKPTQEEADARVTELLTLIEHEMGDAIFSSNGDSLEDVVLQLLAAHDKKLSVAESITGGWLAQRLTSVVNASRSFHGGAIVYASEQKTNLCDVSWELIQDKGAVSPEVARELACGIRNATETAIGLSLTGIAGPPVSEGPDASKPVGLVYIALADGDDVRVQELRLSGDRERIRLWATQHALEMLRRHLM